MTVKELIETLKNLPLELKVVVRGYENGFNDAVSVKMRNIAENTRAEWWDGRYQESTEESNLQAVEIFGDNFIPQK